MTSHTDKPTELLQFGLQHHQAGRLQQAEDIYRQILAHDGDNAEANHLLGLIACQAGKYDAGLQRIRKALKVRPDYPGAHKSLGKVLKGLGRLHEAAASFRKALELKPDYAEAHNDFGIVLKELGQHDQALSSFQKAAALAPAFAAAYYNLGTVFYEKGDFNSARAGFQKAVAIKPDYAEAYNNLGNALRQVGRLDEAAACFHKALSLKPDYAEANNNLGNLLNDQGMIFDAVHHCRKAIALRPDFAEAYSNLGNVLVQQGHLSEAIACFRRAVALGDQPGLTGANINQENAIRSQVQQTKTAADFPQTLKAIQVKAQANLLMTCNYLPHITQEVIYQESLQWGETLVKSLPPSVSKYANVLTTERRLRIGYVSPDFRNHSVAYFIEPVIRAHSRADIEVFCYANVKNPDAATKRFELEADAWRSIERLNDDETSALIRQDSIDILVDLAGYTGENRMPVFARKPAPVQVTWLGYPNTTGLRPIDYRLTDGIADPAGEADRLHSEKLIRLKHGFLCYQPDVSAPEVGPLPCLESEHITFGSFNNMSKSGPEVIKIWAEILHSVADSRLLLKAKQLLDHEIKKRCVEMFAAHGIAAERILLHARLPKNEEHLGLYKRIDIGLDPFPYNGTTTTCEALWMGVPVLTLLGNRHAGRVGASILHRAGLDELVAPSVDEYVRIARALANDRKRLQELRSGLRGRMQGSELMDSRLFAGHLEDVYRRIWRIYCESEAVHG